jgi:hypothetical protein
MVNEVSILCNQRTSLEVDRCPQQLRQFHLYYGKINSSESNYETLSSPFTTSLCIETGMITSKYKNSVPLNYSLNVAREKEKDEIETSGIQINLRTHSWHMYSKQRKHHIIRNIV